MWKSEKGVSAVEFALIAPLLFVLTLGVIEFGVLLFDKAVVTNASREGARAAIVFNSITVGNEIVYDPVSEDQVKEVVNKYVDKYLISLGGPSTPTPSISYRDLDGGNTPERGGDVTVNVAYTYDFLVFPNMKMLLGGTFDGTMDLVGTTVMRME